MPDETTDARTFSESEVRERFISKDVFQDRMTSKTSRISELEGKIGTLQKQLLEAQPRLAQLSELEGRLAERDKTIQAAEDRVALARAGIADDGAVGFLRMAFDQHVAALEEKPDDMAGAFRSWVGSDDGARSNPYVGHLFNGSTAPPAVAQSTAKPAGLPPVNRAEVPSSTRAGQPLTPAQVKSEIGKIRGLPPEEARAALAALRARQTGQR